MTPLKLRIDNLMSRWFSIILGLLLFCSGRPLLAVTYLPDTAPTADISHNTTETIPGPTTRTSIGIKETVTCAINNWSDRDIRVDGSVQTYVSDNYGTINWSAGTGTCNPTMGPTTTYTAPESATATSDTVTMNADDSPLGDDAAINVTLTFTIKVPTSVTATKDADNPYGPAGTNNIGARTSFWLQTSPTDVSFKNVSFRINPVSQTRAFPNASTQTYGGSPTSYSVGPSGGSPNYCHWDYSSGYNAKAVLWNGTAYADCVMIWSVPHEFQANGTWTEYDNVSMKNNYTGSTLQTKVSAKNVFGSLQGPYQ